MNQVLSGSFASRLFANVRTKKGLAYAVFGQVGDSWDHPGLTILFMSTKTETTGAGIDSLLEEARNMTAQPPTEDEVERARKGLLSSFVFKFDSKRKILNQQLSFEFYGYPLDWLATYLKGIQTVTVATEQAAIATTVAAVIARLRVLIVPARVVLWCEVTRGRGRPIGRFGERRESPGERGPGTGD